MDNIEKLEKWMLKLKKVIDDMPQGIECHVSYSSILAYDLGKMEEHINNDDLNGYGINDGSDLCSIRTHSRFIPYSEGT